MYGRNCLLKPKERFKLPVNGKVLQVPAAFRHSGTADECKEPRVSVCKVTQETDSSICGGNNLMQSSQHLFVANRPPGEPQNVARDQQKIYRYAYTPSSSLKPLVRLDWEIYQNVKEIMKNSEETVSSSDNSTDHEWSKAILR